MPKKIKINIKKNERSIIKNKDSKTKKIEIISDSETEDESDKVDVLSDNDTDDGGDNEGNDGSDIGGDSSDDMSGDDDEFDTFFGKSDGEKWEKNTYEFDEDCRLLTLDNIPKTFDDLDFNTDVNKLLKSYCEKKDYMPHLLISGTEGSGKLTRLRCMMSEIYDDKIFNMANRVHHIKIRNGSSTKNVTYGYREGIYHYELEPHLYSSNDRYVIQDFIKRLSEHVNIVSNGITFVIVKGLDKLSFIAQQGLRRLMELKLKRVKLLFTCENLNQITEAIRSRCLVILNPSVTIKDGCKVLKKIVRNWEECPDINKVSGSVMSKRLNHICEISGDGLKGYTNLSKAIRKLQYSYCSGKYVAQQINFHNELEILYKITIYSKKLGYEEVMKIREVLYSLYIELVDFRRFLIIFANRCKIDEEMFVKSGTMYHKLLHLVADTDAKLNDAVKPTLALENFFYKLFQCIHH